MWGGTIQSLCLNSQDQVSPGHWGWGVWEGGVCWGKFFGGKDVWVVFWQALILYHLCFQWAYARVLRGLPFQLPFFTPVCQELSIRLMLPA